MNKLKSKLIKSLLNEKNLNILQGVLLSKDFSIDPRYPIKYIIRGDSYVNTRRGKSRNIHLIQSLYTDLIAKTEGNLRNYDLAYEDKMYNLANQNNLKTVKSEGVFNVYNLLKNKFEKALVIEKINGVTQGEMCSQRVDNIKKRELNKANAKGFATLDCHSDNIMFDKKTSKLYLIDLELWEYYKMEAQN